MLPGFADSKFFQVHEFPTNRVDLLAEIPAELAYEKSGLPISGRMLDEELLKQFGATVRSEEFGKIGHTIQNGSAIGNMIWHILRGFRCFQNDLRGFPRVFLKFLKFHLPICSTFI